MTERVATLEEMQGAYSDLYKDVHGFRPRGFHGWDDYNALGAEIEWLYGQLEQVMEQEKQDQARAVERFEARVADTIAMGAGTREVAIRWIAQAMVNPDPEFLCFDLGIPYGYLGKEWLFERKEELDS